MFPEVLGQAAAVLIALSTFVTFEVTGIGLLAVFHEMLSFAGSAVPRLLEPFLVFLVHILVLIVFNRALAAIKFTTRCQPDSVTRQARRW